MMVVQDYQISAIVIITQARVISFDAPTISPLTPPNTLLERNKRITGQITIAIAAPASFRCYTGRKTSGIQNNAAMNGKYGCEN